NHLSFPNVSIGNMVFQAVRTRFPLRIVAGMTRMGSFAITSVDCYFICNRSGRYEARPSNFMNSVHASL
ncbi:MAG: hypothetical protein ACYDH8_11005, partial [Syntrophales bacterium]